MAQTDTGILSESRVRKKLESLGLVVYKPEPDVGIDIVAYNPYYQTKSVKIQVKGRNPKLIKTYRWFQLRVNKHEMELAKLEGIPANETWRRKVRMVDFFVLDSIYYNEMWVLNKEQIFELIRLNEYQYGMRPDNFFHYEDPIKGRQKEMNLEAIVPDKPIIDRFSCSKDNFHPILSYLEMI